MPYQKKEYQQSNAVNQAQQALQLHQQNKPGEYQSQWQQQMNDLLSQYQNRGPFQYDINADAMYQQMVDRYIQQGQKAMMDTVGQASSLTGGYGNSYAQTAGQQTYQGYLQGANDMLPQFYQMALDRYQNEGEQLLNKYNLTASQEDMEYGRYNDQLNRYLAELDRLQGVYDSERNFDYGKYIDSENMEYQLGRDNQQLAQAQVDYLISIGASVPESLIAASGYDPAYVSAAVSSVQTSFAASSGGGGGGSGGGKYSSGSKMTSTQAALIAKRYLSAGETSSEVKKALQYAGLSKEEANDAIKNSEKIRLEGEGQQGTRKPR